MSDQDVDSAGFLCLQSGYSHLKAGPVTGPDTPDNSDPFYLKVTDDLQTRLKRRSKKMLEKKKNQARSLFTRNYGFVKSGLNLVLPGASTS